MKRSLKVLAAVAAASLIPAGLMAQTVTVGATGDHATLADAVAAVQADPSGPDIIEFLAGSHETDNLTIAGDANANPITLRGEAGERPIVLIKGDGDGITVTKDGEVTVQNLTFIPAEPETAGYANQPVGAFRFTPGTSHANPLTYVFDDVLITSNDGSGAPVTTDGITVPAPTGNEFTFKNIGIRIDSTSQSTVNTVTMTDLIISAIGAGDGFRTFFDGAEGSGILIGEGVVISHLLALSASDGSPDGFGAGAGAIHVGGNEGALQLLTVEGTETNPVLFINNNRFGVHHTNTSQPVSQKAYKHVIIAGNASGGLNLTDASEDYIFENVTIANNGGPAFIMNAAWTGSVTASNLIVAGNGSADADNAIVVASSATEPGEATFTNSAIVTAGTYALTGDGFDPASPANVTLDGVTLNGDPEFISTTPGDADYFRAGSTAYSADEISGAYGTGPDPSSVQDWTLMK